MTFYSYFDVESAIAHTQFPGFLFSSAICTSSIGKVLMTTLKVSAGVQVASGGPSVNLATAIEVDAYTKVEFTLTKANATKAFNLGALGDQIHFVVIKSDLNDSDAATKPKVTYKAGDAAFSLDSPHLYMGPGFVQALSTAVNFTQLSFTFTPLTAADKTAAQDNKQTIADVDSVKVEILVGGPVPTPAKTE